MTGKRVLVTGATAGIGLETAKAIAKEGAELIIVGRNEEKTKAVAEQVKAETGNPNVTFLLADLSSMAQVRRLAADFLARYDRLDVLVNNAGAVNPKRETTADGHESTFATNHLAYFLLTNLLVPALEKAAPSRVVCVASEAHRGSTLDFDDLMSERYSAFRTYSRSKLANILFGREAARRLQAKGISVNTLHPGVVGSNFIAGKGGFWGVIGTLSRVFLISNEQGAKTSVFLATSKDVEGVTGKYFDKCRERAPSAAAMDDAAAAKLWAISEQLTAA
ncbi:MAG: SDR family oxidoreductase [Myxococcaceae bacterium]|nr:SDR family oxidoreductase [Myxococcaceae bacterium]